MADDIERIGGLLREARPSPPLPHGFRSAVWRRIGREEGAAPGRLHPWLLVWVSRVLQPRWALSGLACALVLGASLGFSEGRRIARDTVQARYVAAVAPEPIR